MVAILLDERQNARCDDAMRSAKVVVDLCGTVRSVSWL